MHTLSGGELQRVVPVRALAQETEILLLDEPTSTLEIGNQQILTEVIPSRQTPDPDAEYPPQP